MNDGWRVLGIVYSEWLIVNDDSLYTVVMVEQSPITKYQPCLAELPTANLFLVIITNYVEPSLPTAKY